MKTESDFKSKMTMLCLGVSSFFLVAAVTFQCTKKESLILAATNVCDRIESDYVKATDANVRSFIERCRGEAEQDVLLAMSGRYGPDARRALINIINDRLSLLRVSHLAAYAPDETAAMWTGEAVDTGARGRLVDGEIVVVRVLESSPASRAGLRAGDLVISIDGRIVSDVSDLVPSSGVWEVLRPDDTRLYLPIQAEVLQDRISPHWISQYETDEVRVLRIPTFLPQAFDTDEWPRVRDQIAAMSSRNQRLVIDLRGNPGGSFPAMLRVLGVLNCDRSLVGWIYRGETPSVGGGDSKEGRTNLEMPDSLNSEPQLDRLERNGVISLVPFSTSGCFGGPLGLLMDQYTGSVSEIFVQSLKERPRTLVGGWRSAGQVVMARWFQIAGLSEDYTISVPVALYRSAKGEELESRGVSPDQLMRDSLKRWRSPRDPWLQDLIRSTVSL